MAEYLQKVIIELMERMKTFFYFHKSIQQCQVVHTDINDLLHICLSKLKGHLPFTKKMEIVKIEHHEVKKKY